jgi:acetyl esterase/lipase
MHLRNTLVIAAILAGGPLWLAAWAQDLPGAKTMAERTVPAPAGVSAELRELITSRQIAPAMPVPTTRDAWLDVQRNWDEANAAVARDFARKHGATYESMEVAGVPCFLVTPREVGERFEDRWLVHVHGGAFVLNGGEGCVTEAIWVANACKARVLSIDYRRPPVHPFPAAIEDAVAVWKAVVERQDAAATALFGSSAGGNLSLATTLKLKQLGLPVPGALFAGTPATDLEKTGDTWYTLEGVDPLGRYDGFIRACFEVYAPSEDFSDPLVSPVRGDLRGFPPTILISGTRDLLLSDTVRMHRALRAAGVEAQLHIYEGQSHGDYIPGDLVGAPESLDAQAEIFRFFDEHLE